MKYIIHSASERGFWHNKLGWVSSASKASKFSLNEFLNMNKPASKWNDSEWVVYEYDEI